MNLSKPLLLFTFLVYQNVPEETEKERKEWRVKWDTGSSAIYCTALQFFLQLSWPEYAPLNFLSIWNGGSAVSAVIAQAYNRTIYA